MTSCGDRRADDGLPVAQANSIGVASATSIPSHDPAGDQAARGRTDEARGQVSVRALDDFPRARVDSEGRWETGSLWIERSRDSLCLGGGFTKICPIVPNDGFTPLFAAGYLAPDGQTPPADRTVAAFASADFVRLRISQRGTTVCEVEAQLLGPGDGIAGVECHVPLAGEEYAAEIDLTDREGTVWRIEGGWPIPPAMAPNAE
jgi:hypothetical protein